MNMGDYTSIYNEENTIEEDFINLIHHYFQPRNSNKGEVVIIDTVQNDEVSNKAYQCFTLNHALIEQEHQLASTGNMYKKLLRDLKNNNETDGYLNSINVLFDDLLSNLNEQALPLKIKPYDYKQFLKQITFEFDYSMDYTKLIVRLEQILPMLVNEMNEQSNNKTLIIYLYPESGLSTKEQITFSKLLRSLKATVMVLTESPYFLSETVESMNYYRNSEQKINEQLFDNLFWNAPLNFEREELKDSFNEIMKKYSRMLEIEPVLSNYRITDITLFDFIDWYVCIEFLRHCKYNFHLDVDLTKVSKVHADYLRKYL